MHISDAVASLNYDRYQGFITNESGEAVSALSADKHSSDSSFKVTSLVFDGPAYRGFSASTFTVPQYEYAQKHVRILSGLYGILKPWDLIQEYRLEVLSLFSFLFFLSLFFCCLSPFTFFPFFLFTISFFLLHAHPYFPSSFSFFFFPFAFYAHPYFPFICPQHAPVFTASIS
jgi:Peroxide stress protein YaaA